MYHILNLLLKIFIRIHVSNAWIFILYYKKKDHNKTGSVEGTFIH